jgi:hypothetical protein
MGTVGPHWVCVVAALQIICQVYSSMLGFVSERTIKDIIIITQHISIEEGL